MSHRARHQLLAMPGIIFLVLFLIILSLWIAFLWAKSEVDNQHLSVLKMTLRPNDNLVGKSWGGIMRSNSTYYQDLSQKKYPHKHLLGNL